MKLLFKAFKVVVINDIIEKMPDFKSLPKHVRRVGQIGFMIIAALILATLFFYFSRGHLAKNWIDIPQNISAENKSGVPGLTLSFAGPIGIPPIAISITMIATCLGFGFVMAGARRCHVIIYAGASLIFAGYLALMCLLASQLILWIYFGLTCLLMAVLHAPTSPRKVRGEKESQFWVEVMAYAGLVGLFFGLLKIIGGAELIPVSIIMGQVLMLFILTAYWLLLGMDTVDSGTTAGRWLAGIVTRGLSLKVATIVIPLILIVKIILTILFAPTLIADAIVTSLFLLGILYAIIKKRYDETVLITLTAFSVVASVVTYYILLGLMGKNVSQSVFFVVPTVITFAFFTIWDLVGMGSRFVDSDSKFLPRAGRLGLLVGWILLATNAMFFFFAAGDDAFESFANRASAEAVLVSGIPLILYLIFYRARNIAHIDHEEEFTVKETPKKVIWAFVALGILIAGFLSFTNKLALVQFAKAAILTNRADLVKNSDPKAAEEFFKKSLIADPQYYKGHFNLGTFYYNQKRYEEAVPEFKKAIEVKKDYLQAYINLGVVYSRLEKNNEAQKIYEEALKLEPKMSYAYNNLGVLLMHKGEWEKARDTIKKAIEFSPVKKSTFYDNLGQAEMETREFESGVQHLNEAIKLNPTDFSPYISLGLLYNMWGTELQIQGKNDEAKDRYQKSKDNYELALKNGVGDFLIGTNLSQLYLDMGEFDKAKELAQKTIEKYPNDANMHNILGIILYQMKDSANARLAFQKAKELDKTYFYAFEGEALLDLEAGNYQACVDGYEEALRLGHKRVVTYYNLSLCYEGLKNWDKATENYNAVIQLNQGYVEEAKKALLDIYATQGEAFSEKNEFDAAIVQFEKALAVNPQHVRSLFQYGRVFYKQEKYAESIDYMNKALAADPNYINAYVFLGLSQQALNQIDLALDAYKKGLAICTEQDLCDLIKQAIAETEKDTWPK